MNCPPLSSARLRNGLLLILFFIVGRAVFLEYTNLVDPTESRYATVAQEMLLSGNWLTPTLPSSEGRIPYLGKPPLHFWLTALSYKIFGFDEWTSRFPSLVFAILILGLVFVHGRRYFGEEAGLIAALIAASSWMLYFLAGASVTDVTLTALISGGVVTLYRFVADSNCPTRFCYFAAVFGALAFLVKGPVAIVLIGLPFFLWSLIRKDFAWMRRLHWVRMGILFFAIVTPWFVLSEIQNPGFIEYFIWNENIARYLFKEYGDKYGSGHRHFYGMAWLMLLAGFAPWSLMLIGAVIRIGFKKSWQWVSSDSHRLFTLCWALSAAVFFTFVRQLHMLYIFPCVPGLSVLMAAMCVTEPVRAAVSSAIEKINRPLMLLAVLMWAVAMLIGTQLEYSALTFILPIAIFAAVALVACKTRDFASASGAVGFVSLLIVSVYIVSIACLTPFVNRRHSAEEMLEYVADEMPGHEPVERVGVFSNSSYSHYWTSKAWESELSRRVIVKYVSEDDLRRDRIKLLIIKDRKQPPAEDIMKSFEFVMQKGEWELYRRKRTESDAGESKAISRRQSDAHTPVRFGANAKTDRRHAA
ncbi:MAG: glycosyltransferase family 39 protein [Deltaproteobacteria bacterium]|nr:glycosyltransferase family 39 protein [Deltaproteobacteria bacterium]